MNCRRCTYLGAYDESGCVQMLFREVDKLMKRNKELEAIIQERKR